MYKNLLAGLLISLLLMLTGCGASSGQVAAENEKITPVAIKDLAIDPTAYTGKIEVKGVVQAVDEKKFIFRLIDEEEYKTCGLNPCGTAGVINIYTPDSTKPFGRTPSDYVYVSVMPKVEDRVTVQGEVKKTEDGYAFEVDKVLKDSEIIATRK